MENVMTKGFCELNENEMMSVDGGVGYSYQENSTTRWWVSTFGSPQTKADYNYQQAKQESVALAAGGSSSGFVPIRTGRY